MKRTMDFTAKGVIPFTDEQLAAMGSSYMLGATIEELAKRYGISSTSVNCRLSTMGVQIRKSGPTRQISRETVAKVWEMREARKKWSDIAEAVGFSVRHLQELYRRTRSDGEKSLSLHQLPSAQEA